MSLCGNICDNSCNYVFITSKLVDRVVNVKDYNLELTSEKHQDQYTDYIENKIVCDITFMRYKNLKKIVELYVKFIKNKYSDRINYITDLVDFLPSKSIEDIFDANTLRKLKQVI